MGVMFLKIKIINPNTTWSMTREIEKAGKKYARSDTELVVVSPDRGPVSIESMYDEALAQLGVLEEVKKGIAERFDGFVIACFGDPALYAARELSDIPVVGIAEAAMLMACMLGHQFSILTVLQRCVPMMEEVVTRYGLERRCSSVRASNMSVLELEENSERTEEIITEIGRIAMEEDNAEVLLLGCAGMAGLDRKLEKQLGIPVIDGTVAAVKFLEALHDYEKKTSKILAFKRPEKKLMKGYPDILQP
jgi:allantoin racemase